MAADPDSCAAPDRPGESAAAADPIKPTDDMVADHLAPLLRTKIPNPCTPHDDR